MNMTRIKFAGKVTRTYEEERGGRTNRYVVVSDTDCKYPDILRFTLKPDAQMPCAEGDKVDVSAYVHGREWTSGDGRTVYFTDLRLDTVEVLSRASGASGADVGGGKPTKASDWNALVTLGSAWGEDVSAVTARCRAYRDKVNRKFTAADWQAVADEIVLAHSPRAVAAMEQKQQESFDDDMPF
jgi:hypothetical protein